MKSLYLSLLTIITVFSPFVSEAHNSASHNDTAVEIIHIDAKQLKNWIDQGEKLVLIDARTREYDDGRRISGAIWMPFHTTEEVLADTIGSKDTLVVIYCWSTQCPASGWLAERLVKKGYTNVREFSGGLEEWTKAGYPIENINKS